MTKTHPYWIYLDMNIADQIKKEAIKRKTSQRSLLEEAVLYYFQALKEGELIELDSEMTRSEMRELINLRIKVLAKREFEKRKMKKRIRKEEI